MCVDDVITAENNGNTILITNHHNKIDKYIKYVKKSKHLKLKKINDIWMEEWLHML